MDPSMIAAAAAALLANKAGEGFAGEAGKAAWERMRDLLRSFHRKHPDAPDTLAALAEAESNPGNPAAVRQLALALEGCADSYPSFAADLDLFVQAARRQLRTDSIVVSGNATVGKIAVIGDVTGDVTF
jgi:hypothetical protein